ncbi:MAG: acyl dehydratase [Denitrovibrio sp.]|nr:MAG: acyl dehydratase [Denitrovibrio sp.]
MSNESQLNNVPIDQIKIGMEASYSQTITDADIKNFAGVTGDKNPAHMNDEYAKETQFKERIAHGMLSASYFSTLLGMKLPGEGSIYVSQSLKFKKPVFIGDTVTATVIVTDVNLEKRRVFLRTLCKVKDEIVIDGEAQMYIP